MIKDKILSLIPLENREFLFHAKNYSSATLITKGMGFLLIPVITRILTPKEYGIISVYGSIVAILGIIFGFGLPGAVNRYYHEKNGNFLEFLGANILFLLLFELIILISVFLFRNIIARFMNFNSYLIFLASIVAMFIVFYQIVLYYLNAAKNSVLYSKIQILKGVVIPIVAIIWMLALKENKYMGSIYSSLLFNIIFGTISLIYILKISNINMKKKYIKYSLKFGIPWIPHALSGFILAYFDRIIINQLNGAKDAGLYSFAYNVGLVIYIVDIGFIKSWNPIFYENMNKRNYAKINNMASYNSTIIAFVAILLILFSKEIVKIMASSKYYSALNIVPIIVFSYVVFFTYSLFVNFSFYKKKTYLISINTLIAGTVNVVLNYLLIPAYGYKVAALTTFASYLILLILHYSTVRFLLKEHVIKVKSVLKDYIWVLFYTVVFYILLPLYINIYMEIILKLVLLAPFILYYYRRMENVKK